MSSPSRLQSKFPVPPLLHPQLNVNCHTLFPIMGSSEIFIQVPPFSKTSMERRSTNTQHALRLAAAFVANRYIPNFLTLCSSALINRQLCDKGSVKHAAEKGTN
ncbi:hypothetical protein AVEN_120813-1 [Araneus ventricosus]|uniref:Uncharacterized protein n=1 Tax=Araneus ventricosus TaxID=182803 RepID=A0A4Y2FAU7_ARAVE|nr:hypothetical protein AVEN_120813-1 [Araneus ventricosus]